MLINAGLFVIVGALAAFLLPNEPFIMEFTNPERNWDGPITVVNYGAILWMLLYFLLGGFLSTVVRFVGPKRVHIITFLGTTPIQKLKTGIRFTLPWPFGITQKVIPTDVRDHPIEAQIKPKDNLVYMLPVNAQWYVTDPILFAFERDNPEGQMENLLTSAIRSAGNDMTLFEMYASKDEVMRHAESTVTAQLASFGVGLKELVVQDPHLPESTAQKLSAIREAELDADAATHEATAIYRRMVGAATAEAESTRIKGSSLANFRLLAAEGNAAAIAVMRGQIGIKWVEEKIGEGEDTKTIKRPTFVSVENVEAGHIKIPELDIEPETVLEFFKIVDTNDAIRDAAANPGTVVVFSGGNTQDPSAGIAAALLNNIEHRKAA